MDRERVRGTFRSDLGFAVGAWRRDPRLPVFSVLVLATPWIAVGIFIRATPGYPACLETASCRFPDGARAAVAMAVLFGLVTIGWVGAEREWYRLLWIGERMALRSLPGLIGRYWGPFALFGLLVALVGGFASPRSASVAARVFSYVLVILIDVGLTFVPPALAFSTRRVGRGLSIGLGMIGRTWPGSAPYVLVPPLALAFICSDVVARNVSGVALAVLPVAGALVTLLFKGATAVFYLRHAGPSDPPRIADPDKWAAWGGPWKPEEHR